MQAAFPSSAWKWLLASLVVVGLTAPRLHAQSTSLLRMDTFQVEAGQPLLFTFTDLGTGATNYLLDYTESLDPAPAWAAVNGAIITDLSGGQFQITAPNPLTSQGYYRVRALGGTPDVTASFNASAFQVTEGGMVAPVITFNAPYAGIVRYRIGGTAASGDFQELTGEIMVNGTSATLPVTFTDNDVIGQLKILILTIEDGTGYRLGAGSSTVITLEENDADWRGAFRTRGTGLGFLLSIRQLNGVPIATLHSDALGFFPTNDTSVSVVLQQDSFQADATAIPLDPQDTAFQTPVELRLHLQASNAETNQSVTPTLIEGSGALLSLHPTRPHLNTTNLGTFSLFKPAPEPSTNQVDLVDAL